MPAAVTIHLLDNATESGHNAHMPGSDPICQISEVTRRNIFDRITVGKLSWSGRLDEPSFLSRLYKLEDMGSMDVRFSDAAGDIWQHRVRNMDWQNDWVFTDGRFNLMHCTDEEFLRFLCEMIHPVVQPKEKAVVALLEIFNSELAADGFQIIETTRISGRPVFAAREMVTAQPALEAAKQLGDALTAEHLNRQITRMTTATHDDPELAIGTAKELIETCCKTILQERGKTVNEGWDVPKLVYAALEELKLIPDQVPNANKARDSIRKTLGNLAQVANGAAELRKLFGTGHGKDAVHPSPPPHLARLAVGAASTLVVFLFDTHHLDPP